MPTDPRSIINAALAEPGTNPLTEENLPGATSVTVKFDPDGTYKQNVVGRFSPVKQLAQNLSQAPRKPQNFGALNPEQILAASQTFNQTGAQRQNALGTVANLAAQLQGADTNARAQLLAEHKANNPDLVMTPEGFALPRAEMREYLLGKIRERFAADDAKRQLAFKMLGHEEVAVPNSQAYRGAQGASAGAARATERLRGAQLTGQTLENQSFYPVQRGDNEAMMSTRWEKTGSGGSGGLTPKQRQDAFWEATEMFDKLTTTTEETVNGEQVVPRKNITNQEIRDYNNANAALGIKAKRVRLPGAKEGFLSKTATGPRDLVYRTSPDFTPSQQANEIYQQSAKNGLDGLTTFSLMIEENLPAQVITNQLLQAGYAPDDVKKFRNQLAAARKDR